MLTPNIEHCLLNLAAPPVLPQPCTSTAARARFTLITEDGREQRDTHAGKHNLTGFTDIIQCMKLEGFLHNAEWYSGLHSINKAKSCCSLLLYSLFQSFWRTSPYLAKYMTTGEQLHGQTSLGPADVCKNKINQPSTGKPMVILLTQWNVTFFIKASDRGHKLLESQRYDCCCNSSRV